MIFFLLTPHTPPPHPPGKSIDSLALYEMCAAWFNPSELCAPTSDWLYDPYFGLIDIFIFEFGVVIFFILF